MNRLFLDFFVTTFYVALKIPTASKIGVVCLGEELMWVHVSFVMSQDKNFTASAGVFPSILDDAKVDKHVDLSLFAGIRKGFSAKASR